MDYPWRYHPEFEIIFVEKSNGIRLMGNHAGSFSDGDLMFIHWKYLCLCIMENDKRHEE
jgi:hypothetical protein